MAIIDDRLSTEPQPAPYLDPDSRSRTLNEDYEIGPIAIEDMSEGSRYQTWHLTFSGGAFTLTPEITGSPVVVLTGQTSKYCSFCFDKNGHVYIFWTDGNNLCHFYWYDSVIGDNVITDYPLAFHGMVYLDDKRVMQSGTSDVLLVYTQLNGSEYDLYHERQRDRFDPPILMAEDVYLYVYQSGMHEELRGQITLAKTVAVVVPPTIPPGPILPQQNLDFELGDAYWAKTGSFAITSNDPYEGSYSASLDTSVDDSLLNEVFTLILPESPAYVSCVIKGDSITTIKLGFKFYNEVKALVDTQTSVKAVTTSWTAISFNTTVPANAVYLKIYVESDNTIGPVTIDNFSFYGIDLANAFTVKLDFPEFMQVNSTELFEVEV